MVLWISAGKALTMRWRHVSPLSGTPEALRTRARRVRDWLEQNGIEVLEAEPFRFY